MQINRLNFKNVDQHYTFVHTNVAQNK